MPPLFPARRLGKWGREEESYAARLIQEFEWGYLNECENGTTLRAFLAVQLNCAPMRISKKYAGKAIGKHVFMRSDENKHLARNLLPSTKQLRFDFLTACYKKIDMEMPADVATETNPSNDTETVDGAAAEEEKQPQPHHQQLQQQQPVHQYNAFYGYDPNAIVSASTGHYAPFGLDHNRVPYATQADSLNELYTNFKRAQEESSGSHAEDQQLPVQAQGTHAQGQQGEGEVQGQRQGRSGQGQGRMGQILVQQRQPTHTAAIAPTSIRTVYNLTQPPTLNNVSVPVRSQPIPAHQPNTISSDFQQWLRNQPQKELAHQYYQSSTTTQQPEEHPSSSNHSSTASSVSNASTSGIKNPNNAGTPNYAPNEIPTTTSTSTSTSTVPKLNTIRVGNSASNNNLKKVTQKLLQCSNIASAVASYQFGYGDPIAIAQNNVHPQPSQVTANTLKIHQKQQAVTSKDPKLARTNYTHPALKPIGSSFPGDSHSDENVNFNSDPADNSDSTPTALISRTEMSDAKTNETSNPKEQAKRAGGKSETGDKAVTSAKAGLKNATKSLVSSSSKEDNVKSLVSTSSNSSSSRSEGSAGNSPSPTTNATERNRKKASEKAPVISDGSEQSNSCTDSNSDNYSDQGSSDRGTNSTKYSEQGSSLGSSEQDSNSEHGSSDEIGSVGDGAATATKRQTEAPAEVRTSKRTRRQKSGQ